MHESCGCRITAITPAFQAGDEGSTPFIRCSTQQQFFPTHISISTTFSLINIPDTGCHIDAIRIKFT